MAQDATGGLRFSFDISSELRYHDNLDLDPVSAGPTLRSDTKLGFGIVSETRRQRFELGLGGTLRAEDVPGTGSDFGLESPGADLFYSLTGANARLAIDAGFRRRENDGFSLLDQGDDPGGTDLIADTGYRDSARAKITLETGLNDPLGFVFELEHRADDYVDTTDPSLFDRTTDRALVQANLRFTPVTMGWVAASATRYRAEDAFSTMRDDQALTLGVSHQLSEGSTLDASLGEREIDSSVTGVMRMTEASLSLTHEMPRGMIGMSLNRELTTAGYLNKAEVERQFLFPNSALTVSLGVVEPSVAKAQVIGGLSYSHELPMGEFTASFSRSVSVTDETDIQRTTRGALGLTAKVNNLSSLRFGVDYADFADAGTGGLAGRSGGRFSAVYERELAREWVLSVGYEHRYLNEAGSAAAWDKAAFVGFSRGFSWQP